jgi:hypothetical protein
MSDNTQQKAQLLANKLDKLNEHFDIVESTINECTEYVESLEGEIVSEDLDINESENNGFISDSDVLTMLKTDFMSSRETLIDTIKNGKIIINTVSNKISMFDEETNADLISAYAVLIKTVNDSTKLLIGLYKDIISTHKLLQDQSKKDISGVNFEGDVTINSIGGRNISDIIREIQNKGVL